MANNNNAIPTVHNLSLRTILEKERLNNGNFMDWYRNLRIVLRQEKKSYVLDDPIPDQPDEDNVEAFNDWVKYVEDSVQVSCLMLASMTPDLQKDFENHNAYDMITQLKEMFQQQSRVERFETVRALHACRMDETQSVSSYVLKIKSHIDRLERLNCRVSNQLATDLILNSLSKPYLPFLSHFRMTKSIVNYHDLLELLQTFEKDNQLHKETVNLVGGSSLGSHHPFKKEKKKKNKKVQGAGSQSQKFKFKTDQSQAEYFCCKK